MIILIIITGIFIIIYWKNPELKWLIAAVVLAILSGTNFLTLIYFESIIREDFLTNYDSLLRIINRNPDKAYEEGYHKIFQDYANSIGIDFQYYNKKEAILDTIPTALNWFDKNNENTNVIKNLSDKTKLVIQKIWHENQKKIQSNFKKL